MPIDFFTAPCTVQNGNCQVAGIVCKSSTTSNRFGLCDDPPPSTFPAYIQLHTPDDWIAEVNNPNSKNVTFKAIDNCVPILRANNELESRCDGMLIQANDITFVELKDRGTSGWLSKGREQLTISIQSFINNNTEPYNILDAYVSNKQRPLAVMSITNEVQKFKDETALILGTTGLLLKADRNIAI